MMSNYALERSVTALSRRAAGARKTVASAAHGPGCARPAQRGRHTSMYLNRLVASIGLAAFSCGCAIHDAVFTYNVSGRLIGEDATSLAARPMYVQLEPFVPSDTQFPTAVLTEPNGHFSQDAMTKLAWGYHS